jgi:hypothetical protein
MEIYSAFNIKVNNTNREAGRFPYFFVPLGTIHLPLYGITLSDSGGTGRGGIRGEA